MRAPWRLAHVPVRWRLTLWYAAVLAVVLALFAAGLFLGLRQRLHAALDEQLFDQAALTLRSVETEDDIPRLAGASELVDGEYFLRLFDADGEVVQETRGDEDIVPPPPEVFRAALGGQNVYSDATDSEAETTRVLSIPVRAAPDRPPIGVMQVGLDRDEIDEPLAELLRTFAIAVPVALLLASASGYLLAGRALAPVSTITTLASRIDGSELGARLDLKGPNDELGRLARTFDAMLARIDDACERQRRFTGDAAHELRTPLSLMRTQVDLALARPRSETEYQDALRGLDSDLERMTGLVGALLTLARADAGKFPLNKEPLDLALTIEAVADQYEAVAAEAGITMRTEASQAVIAADEGWLVQLLVNLVDNAVAHTPAGGVITLGCAPDAGQTRLWVSDTGDGIDPVHQPHVFDRFYRIDASRARSQGGTGLGLAICRAIVEAHQGTVSLQSAPGQGTRVTAILPNQ